jgi:hypothetical protein
MDLTEFDRYERRGEEATVNILQYLDTEDLGELGTEHQNMCRNLTVSETGLPGINNDGPNGDRFQRCLSEASRIVILVFRSKFWGGVNVAKA